MLFFIARRQSDESPPSVIIENFLPEEAHLRLLQPVLAVGNFASGKVHASGKHDYAPALRQSVLANDRLGPFLAPFRATLRMRFDNLCTGLRVQTFDTSAFEIRLIAHDGRDFTNPSAICSRETKTVPHAW